MGTDSGSKKEKEIPEKEKNEFEDKKKFPFYKKQP